MIDYQIISIQKEHINDFWLAVDSVARERKYLAFLEGPPIETTIDFVAKNINESWPHVLAIAEGKIIGWCDITSLDRPIFAHRGVLGIGILAPYRRMGIGSQLIKTALDKAQKKGLTRIELTVREHNQTALSLYKKFGFEIEGIHKKGVFVDGIYEDLIFMALLYK
ncbi:GNAT family N-acetyltransferase [Legionella gresilensis]|uniref:GNAT family N-acetyltransferase n=1 Tax=Legionella gresilensis TaxID=91823 RepID=UPI001A94DC30|nr:GNAT family N-acetyltransferase [Legionella gresilensis]